MDPLICFSFNCNLQLKLLSCHWSKFFNIFSFFQISVTLFNKTLPYSVQLRKKNIYFLETYSKQISMIFIFTVEVLWLTWFTIGVKETEKKSILMSFWRENCLKMMHWRRKEFIAIILMSDYDSNDDKWVLYKIVLILDELIKYNWKITDKC